MSERIDRSMFCEHGVFMGDANQHRPCPRCSETDTLARAMTAEAMTAYLALEKALCTCDPDEGLDTCGWDA